MMRTLHGGMPRALRRERILRPFFVIPAGTEAIELAADRRHGEGQDDESAHQDSLARTIRTASIIVIVRGKA